MTLYELLHQLLDINYKVTSADFETNVLTVKANLEGDWKKWNVKIHTADEERLTEEGEELACNCEKKGYERGFAEGQQKSMEEGYKQAVNKACEWMEEHLNDDFIKRVSIEEFKKAMEV